MSQIPPLTQTDELYADMNLLRDELIELHRIDMTLKAHKTAIETIEGQREKLSNHIGPTGMQLYSEYRTKWMGMLNLPQITFKIIW